MPSPELTRPCGDMADVGWASRAAEGPEGTHAEGAHGHPNDRAGRLAHQSPSGIAPPGDRRGPRRRRHRSADQASSKGSRAACWMRLVVDTNVVVSAALIENSLRSSLPAESVSMTRPASALHRSGNDLSLHEGLARGRRPSCGDVPPPPS